MVPVSSASRALLLMLVCSAAVATLGSESNHRYKDGETVTLWVNKVGPYNNPQVGMTLAADQGGAVHPGVCCICGLQGCVRFAVL